MSKGTVGTLIAALVLSTGCASLAGPGEESERLEQARADVRLEPLLNDSRVTLSERDGVLVFGGSVDTLQDLNVVRDIVLEFEDEGPVENAVVLLGTDIEAVPEAGS